MSSDRGPGRDASGDASRRRGARTGQGGTPVAVDVSGDVARRKTLALFVAAPIIWTVHFLVVYLVTEAGCTGSGPGLEIFAPPVPTIVTLAATAVAVVGCLVTAAWGYRRWRTDKRRRDADAALAPHDIGGALAFAGFLMSLLGVVTVLMVGLPALVLETC